MDDIELALSKLFASYPNVAVSEATVASYVEGLADIPPAELLVVVKQCLRECKYLPTIAELYERWSLMTQCADQLNASEAWGLVTDEIRRVGSWGKPEFTNALVAKTVGIIGWLELCQSENVIADRAHFLRIYGDLVARHDQNRRLLPEARQLAAQHNGLTHISALLPKIVIVEDSPHG